MSNSTLRDIWMVSREYGELAGAGGVKDVVKQLAEALARKRWHKISVVMPCYGFVDVSSYNFLPLNDPMTEGKELRFSVDMNYGREERLEECRVHVATVEGVTIYLIAADRFNEKNGVYTYTEQDGGGENWNLPGMGHYDYFAMNLLLQKAALELMMILGQRPGVIHCHDGHTALIPALIHECQGWRSFFRETGCLVTIHNAGLGYHQEVADIPFAHAITALPLKVVSENRLAGKFDPLLAAGQYAILNTVSENYAVELQETDADKGTDWLGHTLLERGVMIEGVTNGITPEDYNPARGAEVGLPDSYNPGKGELAGKLVCKEHLLKLLQGSYNIDQVHRYGSITQDSTQPLFTFIGRLSQQKGVDLLIQAIEQYCKSNDRGQVIIFGSGDATLEAALFGLVEKEEVATRVCFLKGYNSLFANLIYGGGDFFMMPSRFEPCGLTDFIAQLFGNIPIVHHVGGLVKVEDEVTGLAYQEGTAEALSVAMDRALHLYDQPRELRRIQKKAVSQIKKMYSWDVVVTRYQELYKRAYQKRKKVI